MMIMAVKADTTRRILLSWKNVALSGQTRDNSARMSHTQRAISLRKIIWVMYLAVALVFVQGVRLHAHTYAHEASTGHGQPAKVHSDFSTSDEHTEVTAQIDLTTQSMLKKLTSGSLIIALLVVAIVFLSLNSMQCRVWLPNRRAPFTPRRGCQPPPLRGPPAIF